MTDFTRNTRTLIICFVIAIFGLLPLRFYEEGQNLAIMESERVLGTAEESDVYEAEAMLSQVAQAAVPEVYMGFEAPYDRIESGGMVSVAEVMDRDLERVLGESCISEDEAELMTSPMIEQLNSGVSNEEEINRIHTEVNEVVQKICR